MSDSDRDGYGDRRYRKDKHRGRRERSRSRDRDHDGDRRDRDRHRDRDRRDRDRRDRYRRSRSRSRDRQDRGRHRDYDRGRDTNDTDKFEKDTGLSIEMLSQLQQQALQRQLVTQQAAANVNAYNLSAQAKKARQLYVGNLHIGIVSESMIQELFNAALAQFVPDPVTNPPVVHVSMDPSGRYGFVELRTDDLATEAVKLDKTQLCGRQINVGRPKGYMEPSLVPGGGAMAAADFVAKMTSQEIATKYLLMENILTCGMLRDDEERLDLSDEFFEECSKFGNVTEVYVPVPTSKQIDTEPGRVYVVSTDTDEARKIRTIISTRTFEERRVLVKYVLEQEYVRARNNSEWIDEFTRRSIIQLVGDGSEPLPVMDNGAIGHTPSEGYLKAVGLPLGTQKEDLVRFFVGCGSITDDEIQMVYTSGGRETGDAIISFFGFGANLDQAMARNGTALPGAGVGRFVTLKECTEEDIQALKNDGMVLM